MLNPSSPAHPIRQRNLQSLLLLSCVALLIWLLCAFQMFVFVRDKASIGSDAVVVLGGASKERLPVALSLQEFLNVPVLVVSRTDTPGNASADALCRRQAPKPNDPVVCLSLDRKDTRGEARAIGWLAESEGWTTITVVTSRYHMTRAETLIGQCTSAEIGMVGSTPELSLTEWLFRLVEETGGLMDAMARPECPH